MRVTEVFSSIQGEGPSCGRPATFLRLSGCDLKCTFCDTKFSWMGGVNYEIEEVLSLLSKYNLFKDYYLCITGGEPLLQSTEIAFLLKQVPSAVKLGIETNGTRFKTFNRYSSDSKIREVEYIVSPKLSNSGNPKDKAKVHEDWFEGVSRGHDIHFKFVVGSLRDYEEVEQYIVEHNIPDSQVWLMPECTTRKEHFKFFSKLFSLAAEQGYNLSPRLQILAFGNRRGV